MKMKKVLALLMLSVLLLLMVGCNSQPTESPLPPDGYPKMEELPWSFRNMVHYEEPVAVFDYTNHSEYTVTFFELHFKLKDGVTSEQLNLLDRNGERVTVEISNVNPYVFDYIVCKPGQSAQGAPCYMYGNYEANNAAQCEFMELVRARIEFIGDDGKVHSVSYNEENKSYALSELSAEAFVWIAHEYSDLIPKPDSPIAQAEDYQGNLCVDVYDFTYDDFLSYIEQCEEKGFVESEASEASYWAKNPDGIVLHLRYIEYMHKMEIEVKGAGE